jgi:hypothetical protein
MIYLNIKGIKTRQFIVLTTSVLYGCETAQMIITFLIITLFNLLKAKQTSRRNMPHLNSEDGGDMFLQNVDLLSIEHTALHQL